MRLRSLRKLEEIEIQKEHDALSKEKQQLESMLASKAKCWKKISSEIAAIQKQFGEETELGKRRTDFADAPANVDISIEAFVEREPITILCSRLGWIRSLKGHGEVAGEKYKEGDEARFMIKAYTTDKLLVFGTNGRFYTIRPSDLPSGRGFGEPIRLMVDLDQQDEIADLLIHKPGGKWLVASTNGKGFIVPSDDVVAQTKNGKQVLNSAKGSKAMLARATEENHDHVAIVGTNRKLLVFPLEQIPEMKRGQGVFLQRYKDAKLSDIKSFAKEEGLSWSLGDRTRTEEDITPWLGTRAAAGKLPPTGFPKGNSFS
jgi:topoisomerase-4 subunit A